MIQIYKIINIDSYLSGNDNVLIRYLAWCTTILHRYSHSNLKIHVRICSYHLDKFNCFAINSFAILGKVD